jgi:hypothetical protein
MLIATSTAAEETAYLADLSAVALRAKVEAPHRAGGPTMKFGVPVPSHTAIDSIDQENFKAW